MTSRHVMPGGGMAAAGIPGELADRLPGVIFQLHRRHDGHLHFPYLAGSGLRLIGISPERLAEDARPALERLDDADFPRLMAAIERSVNGMTPIATKFRLRVKGHGVSWIAMRAQPGPVATGVLWHGMLLDVSEQVAEEARLRRLSDTDDLTGSANRRKLMDRLDEEISLSNRHGTPLSLMMLDIDHFKRINDTHGHLQGDEVLKSLAEICRQALREEDLVARLGGEEFALLLPLTPQSRCHGLAERLRRRIAQHDFGLEGTPVTVSIGIAEHRIGDSRDALIARADHHLYAAKRGGRNRVVAVN
ncbi:sensor domain-containing diguanylate cyclase [Halomonas sp. 3H]|uniref:GGDEF domain-containing protein n=1 Tax=Halomonas sp. 3H TaxID=2952527 RepID=UPI0020B8196C|nr:sensor domain-containing diguanylate cyclase [Halomonas sp. 3H]